MALADAIDEVALVAFAGGKGLAAVAVDLAHRVAALVYVAGRAGVGAFAVTLTADKVAGVGAAVGECLGPGALAHDIDADGQQVFHAPLFRAGAGDGRGGIGAARGDLPDRAFGRDKWRRAACAGEGDVFQRRHAGHLRIVDEAKLQVGAIAATRRRRAPLHFTAVGPLQRGIPFRPLPGAGGEGQGDKRQRHKSPGKRDKASAADSCRPEQVCEHENQLPPYSPEAFPRLRVSWRKNCRQV